MPFLYSQRILTFVMAIAATGAFCCYAEEPVALKLAFQAGETYAVQLDSTTEIVSTVDRRSRQVDSQVVLDMTASVVGVDDAGTGSMRYVINGLAVKAGPPGELGDRVVDFDTRVEKQIVRGISRELKSQAIELIGSSFEVKVSAAGETQSASEIESSNEAELNPRLAQLLNADTLLQAFQSVDVALPGEKVDVSDTWSAVRAIEVGGESFRIETTQTLGSLDKGVASLEFKTLENASIGDTAGKLRVIDASLTGDATFNYEAGFFDRRNLITRTKTESTYRDMTLETSIVLRTVLTSTKK